MPESTDSKGASALDVVKTVVEQLPLKDAYADGVQPSLSELGRFGQTIGLLLNHVVRPLRRALVNERLNDVEQDLRLVLARRNIEQPLIEPRPTIAYPALQGYLLSEGEPELRRLYIELLATAMDPATAGRAHPSFVGTIQNLTSDEAKILEYLAHVGREPMIAFFRQGVPHSVAEATLLADKAGCQYPDQVRFYLENLERLAVMSEPKQGEKTDLYNEPFVSLKDHARGQAAIATAKCAAGVESLITWPFWTELSVYGKQLAAACQVAPATTLKD